MQEGNKRASGFLPTKYGRAIVKGPGCMALWQVMQHDLSNATMARLSCGQLVCLPNSDSLGGYFSRWTDRHRTDRTAGLESDPRRAWVPFCRRQSARSWLDTAWD